jgi:peptidyl-prolyl cis-trans isomerase SurA
MSESRFIMLLKMIEALRTSIAASTRRGLLAAGFALAAFSVTAVAMTGGGWPTHVVEQVVARVNNSVITTFDLQTARQQLLADYEQQQKQGTTPDAQQQLQQSEKDLLASLIDKQLLLQRASDLGLSAETDTIRRLDEIRRSMNLPSMEDLQKAVEAQGQDYEDFKQSIRDQILTQKVIEQDVAPRIDIRPEEIAQYYQQHKNEFVRQHEVGLSEILIPTKNHPASDLPKLKKLADELQQRAAKGETFATMAQKYSAGTTAQDGGSIGFFKENQLSPELAKAVFSLPEGGVTPVMSTANGYLILRVDTIHHAGLESLDEARTEIQYQLYQQKLQPELRHYLAKLRNEAYVTIAKGYVDTGSTEEGPFNIERFERVLPQDLPKQTDKEKKSG